jgi:hypothetical protein
MKVELFYRIVTASCLAWAVQAAWTQTGPPMTDQLGKSREALRQADQQCDRDMQQQHRISQRQAHQHSNDTVLPASD